LNEASPEYWPEIESDITLPVGAVDAMPPLSPAEELQMRARTIKLISDITGTGLAPSPTNQEAAESLARRMMEDPKARPDFAQYPNETIAYLAGMVAQSNCMIVDELSELKLYVVNKLVLEVEQAKNAKDRITALSKLGEVDGVDAFKKRTESTFIVKPLAEVEKELLSVLEGIEFEEVVPKNG
jgi:hypothetical protein